MDFIYEVWPFVAVCVGAALALVIEHAVWPRLKETLKQVFKKR